MGFAWNNFGILVKENEDDRYLYIYNQNDEFRQISKSKYAPSLPNLRMKINTLIGKPITFRTSQNTANWATSLWFSDIDIDEIGLQNPDNIIPFSQNNYTEGNEPPPISHEDLINKLESFKSRLENELDGKPLPINNDVNSGAVKEKEKNSKNLANEEIDKIQNIDGEAKKYFFNAKSHLDNFENEMALKNLKKSAELGYKVAYSEIANQYCLASDSNPVDGNFRDLLDIEEAIEFAVSGVEVHNDTSQLILFQIYIVAMMDNHLRCNIEEFWYDKIQYLQLMADNDVKLAQAQLAYEYHMGTNVEKDNELAIHWYTLAFAENNSQSFRMDNFIILLLGMKLYSKAKEYLEIAFNNEDRFACVTLGYMSEVGMPEMGINANYNDAAKYYRTGLKRKSIACMFHLGKLFLNGNGVKLDKEKGIKFIRRSAEYGDDEAQMFLGELYEDGFSFYNEEVNQINYLQGGDYEIPYDLAKNFIDQAYFWYEKAANQNNANAAYKMYEHLVEDNYVKDSDYWLRIAASLNHEIAKEILDESDISESYNSDDKSKVIIDNKNIIPFPIRYEGAIRSETFDTLKARINNEIISDTIISEYVPTKVEELKDLISKGENSSIEFKHTFSTCTRTGKKKDKEIRYAALREICGFLNSNDGILFIGVTDDLIIDGIEKDGFKDDKDEYSRTISNLVESSCGALAASFVEISFEILEEKTICIIKCEKSSEPIYLTYKGKEQAFLVRYGSITKEPPPAEMIRWVNTKFVASG